MHEKTTKTPDADVCLVLDGGYPDVTGGVSVWVHELTHSLPAVRFALARVREEGDIAPRPAYELAPNVVSLVDLPAEAGRDELPAGTADQLPAARVYHALITGRASGAAAGAAAGRGRPLLVTEHGLAWREADWITGCNPHLSQPDPKPAKAERERRSVGLRRQAQEAYRRAAVVTSVCSINALTQRRLGAPPERSIVIPNCTTPGDPRAALNPPGKLRGPLRIGFVGRVVPIKDVLALLQAVALFVCSAPAEVAIVGPLHHDPGYVERCRELTASLGLAHCVQFVGEDNPARWYPKLDTLVLPSVSEAQPLVLLEAMGAGLPTVATSVGGVPELLAGPLAGDPIGPAGLLVRSGDTSAMARALLALWSDPALRLRLGANGRERVLRRHTPHQVWDAYRSLYERLAA